MAIPSTTTDPRDALALRAWQVARRYAAGWPEAGARPGGDDVAQETALALLRCRTPLRDAERLPGYVRVVARRLRLRGRARLAGEVLACDLEHEERPLQSLAMSAERGDGTLLLDDRWVDRQHALEVLQGVLERLAPLNQRILLDYYSGRSCADVARSHRLSPHAVKARLARGRRLLRQALERKLVRARP